MVIQISGASLGVGANVITVSGTNASGSVASDSVTIIRQSHQPTNPKGTVFNFR